MSKFQVFILVLALGSSIFVAGLFAPSQTEVVLEWKPYGGSDSGESGFLFELSDVSGESAYLSTDKEITSLNTHLLSGWTIKKLSEEELWNPRLCAKMPLTMTEYGDIFMYEAERQGVGKFISKIVWFSKKEAQVRETNVTSGTFVGRYLFTDKDGLPYFISEEEKVLYKNTIDVASEVMRKEQLLVIAEKETVTLEKIKEMRPLLEVYNAEKFLTTVFELDGLKLKEVADFKPKLRESDDIYVVADVGYDFQARYRPDGPYETSVLFKETEVFSFLPENKVYSYVLGAYR